MAGRSRGTFVMSSRTASYALLMMVIVGAGVAVMRWGEPISPATGGWVAYGADSGNTKYSALSKIDPTNARNLRIAWRWSSPDNAIVSTRPHLHPNLFEATPVVHDGYLYVATGLHQVASIQAATGVTRWVYDPALYDRGTPQRLGWVHRGVALWPSGSRVFLASGDGYLAALDTAAGMRSRTR